MSLNVLLIGQQEESLWFQNLVNALAKLGELQVLSVEDAMMNIPQYKYGIIVIDKSFVENEMLLVANIRSLQPDARIIAITSTPTWRQIREILKAGAMDYISKSMSEREYLIIFKDALDKRPLVKQP